MDRRMKLAGAALYCILAGTVAASAQQPAPAPAAGQTPMAAMPMDDAEGGGDTGPSSQAFRASNARMAHDMNVRFTGDTDLDFVRGMVPHHQGAVDMARVELQYGKDPQLRKLARNIIASQQQQVAFMDKWLAAHGK